MAIDLLNYTNLKDYFVVPDNINLSRNTRAKLFIERCPNINFFCQSFTIPDMVIQPVDIGTSSIKTITEPGEQFTISPFNVNLIIDENFECYLEIVRWFQYVVRNGSVPESYSNLLAIIYNSELEPIISLRFFYVFPSSIAELTFNDSENEVMTLPISFGFTDLEIEKIGSGERLFQDFMDEEDDMRGQVWNKPTVRR
jgi:hypothetical protein